MMRLPSSNPVTMVFWSTDAPYSPSDPHKGVDFGYRPDSKVYMPEKAVVQVLPWDGKTREGNVIHIYVGNRHWALCHLSQFLVKNGQMIAEGTPIGIMGDTGFATGVHLHAALTVDRVLVDCVKYVKEHQMATDSLTKEEVQVAHQLAFFQPAPQSTIDYYTGKTNSQMLTDFANSDARKGVEAQFAASGGFTPVGETLYRKV